MANQFGFLWIGDYGVSLTAAALRWIEIADKRAVLVASRDDYMLWAKSNEAAFKSRAFFATRKNTIEVPRDALAHSNQNSGSDQSQNIRAQVWFPREPSYVELTEMTKVAGNYDYTLSLLLMMGQGFNIIDAVVTVYFLAPVGERVGRVLHIGLKPVGISNLRDMDEVDAQFAQALMRALLDG